MKFGLGQLDTVKPRPRPLSFYGPYDWDGVTPWQEIDASIRNSQREWDAWYLSLSRWQRFKVRWAGLLTEPVGTSCGMKILAIDKSDNL